MCQTRSDVSFMNVSYLGFKQFCIIGKTNRIPIKSTWGYIINHLGLAEGWESRILQVNLSKNIRGLVSRYDPPKPGRFPSWMNISSIRGNWRPWNVRAPSYIDLLQNHGVRLPRIHKRWRLVAFQVGRRLIRQHYTAREHPQPLKPRWECKDFWGWATMWDRVISKTKNGSRHIHVPSVLNIHRMVAAASRTSSMHINSRGHPVQSSRCSKKDGGRILISSSLFLTSSKKYTIRITSLDSWSRIAADDEEICGIPKVSMSGGMLWTMITCLRIRSVISWCFDKPIRWSTLGRGAVLVIRPRSRVSVAQWMHSRKLRRIGSWILNLDILVSIPDLSQQAYISRSRGIVSSTDYHLLTPKSVKETSGMVQGPRLKDCLDPVVWSVPTAKPKGSYRPAYNLPSAGLVAGPR